MKELKGTKTEKNLQMAFAGESQARNKYTYFASKAKKEGYEQIAAIFSATADNEKEHAKMWFKELGELGDTAQNLRRLIYCLLSIDKNTFQKQSYRQTQKYYIPPD